MKKFRWAYIGSGRIANITAKEICSSGRHEIVTVYSRNEQCAKKFANKYNCLCAKTIEEAIDRNDVDGVYIATPKHVHFEHAMMALNYGKAVLVEKPFVVNEFEGHELLKCAQKNNLYLAEAMCMRYNPIILKLGDISQKYGRPTRIHIDYAMAQKYFIRKQALTDVNLAGGALLEIGEYGLSLSNYLNANEQPQINVNVAKLSDGVDITSEITLEYQDCSTRLFTSLTHFKGFPTARLQAESWNCCLSRFSSPHVLKLTTAEKNKTIADGRYIYEFDYIASEIRNGQTQSQIVTHHEMLNNMACLDLCRKQMGIVYTNDSRLRIPKIDNII